MFSQIQSEDYKVKEIRELLTNVILNFEETDEEDKVIHKLANKCRNIKWLRDSNTIIPKSDSPSSTNSSDSDLTEFKISKHASIKAGLRSDYHKHTTVHNFMERRNSEKKARESMIMENNANVFLSNEMKEPELNSTEDEVQEFKDSNILDLPTEYLNSKPLPKIPIPKKKQNQIYASNNSSSTSIGSNNSLKQKALKKTAPPPPDGNNKSRIVPPPPPPRRRK
ncbi:unnamed protein product [Candida verbasci]|uniref:Uncharacterized protein n=1 Tax=Candida verbasci TaxID=1227364 RepID=A0A9W4TS80_9ASCO|nr:unnamed protein product [Candida verbasci]